MALSELEEIFRAYDEALRQAHRKSSIFAGLFGQGSFDDPRSAPCNRAFHEAVGAWIRDFAASEPEEASAAQVCCFLMEAASKRLNTPSYWYTLIAQGYIRELIPLLDQKSRHDLALKYNGLYPKRQRLPIQEEVYQALTP